MPAQKKRWWVVTGRISGEWEDTISVFHCSTETEAVDEFKRDMIEGTDRFEGVPEDELPEVYVTTVAVSDTKIEVTTYQL